MVAVERTRGRSSFSVGSDEQHLGDIVRTTALHTHINPSHFAVHNSTLFTTILVYLLA